VPSARRSQTEFACRSTSRPPASAIYRRSALRATAIAVGLITGIDRKWSAPKSSAVGIVAGGAARKRCTRDQKHMTIAPVAIRFPIIMIPPMSRILMQQGSNGKAPSSEQGQDGMLNPWPNGKFLFLPRSSRCRLLGPSPDAASHAQSATTRNGRAAQFTARTDIRNVPATTGRANLPIARRRSPSPISASSTLPSPMAFLPNDQGLLVTEKAGALKLRQPDGKVVDIAACPRWRRAGRAACSMLSRH